MKIIEFILNLVIFVLVMLIVSNFAFYAIADYSFKKIALEEEIIYPDRFSLPAHARRLIPFYMSQNLIEYEYIPPVYDIIKVEGIGKLIAGAEVTKNLESYEDGDDVVSYNLFYNGIEYTNLATAVSNIQDDVFPCSKEDFVNFILVYFDSATQIHVHYPSYNNTILSLYVEEYYTSIYDQGLQGSLNQNEDVHNFLTERFDNPYIDWEFLVVSDLNEEQYTYFYGNADFMLIKGDSDREYQVFEFDFTSPEWYYNSDVQNETALFEFGGEYSVKLFENVQYW